MKFFTLLAYLLVGSIFITCTSKKTNLSSGSDGTLTCLNTSDTLSAYCYIAGGVLIDTNGFSSIYPKLYLSHRLVQNSSPNINKFRMFSITNPTQLPTNRVTAPKDEPLSSFSAISCAPTGNFCIVAGEYFGGYKFESPAIVPTNLSKNDQIGRLPLISKIQHPNISNLNFESLTTATVSSKNKIFTLPKDTLIFAAFGVHIENIGFITNKIVIIVGSYNIDFEGRSSPLMAWSNNGGETFTSLNEIPGVNKDVTETFTSFVCNPASLNSSSFKCTVTGSTGLTDSTLPLQIFTQSFSVDGNSAKPTFQSKDKDTSIVPKLASFRITGMTEFTFNREGNSYKQLLTTSSSQTSFTTPVLNLPTIFNYNVQNSTDQSFAQENNPITIGKTSGYAADVSCVKYMSTPEMQIQCYAVGNVRNDKVLLGSSPFFASGLRSPFQTLAPTGYQNSVLLSNPTNEASFVGSLRDQEDFFP